MREKLLQNPSSQERSLYDNNILNDSLVLREGTDTIAQTDGRTIKRDYFFFFDLFRIL